MSNEIKVGIGGKVEPSFKSTVQQVKDAVRETAKETGKIAAEIAVTNAAHATMGRAGSAAFSVIAFAARRSLATILPTVASTIGGISLLVGSVKILSGTLSLLERASGTATAGLSKFSMLEDLAAKLRRVSSSAEAARQKVGEVATTFRGTPVAVPDAVDAYRSARVADSGSGELSDSKSLTLLGDVAAASGNNIKDVAGAVGSLYSDLQAGQPIKESADKLRDLGVISGDTRTMLDSLLASGRSGPEVWAALRASLETTSGAMKEQQQTLSGLQKAVQAAKDQLYESFGEGSVPFEKDSLSARLAVLQKIEPVAREAGNVYGGFKSILAENVKAFLAFIGVKAASDKALGNSEALKTATDSYILLRIALVAFAGAALVALPVCAGLAIAAGTLSVAVIGTVAAFAGITAAAVTAVAGLGIYVIHLKQATDARLAYVNASQELVNGLRKEESSMVTAAERAKVLANAYAIAKKALEDYTTATAKGPRKDAEVRLKAVQSEIGRIESNSDILPGLRAKLRDQIAAAKTPEDRGPLLVQEARLTERINRGERGTLDDLPSSDQGQKVKAELDARNKLTDADAADKAEADARMEKSKADSLEERARKLTEAASPENAVKAGEQIDGLLARARDAERKAQKHEHDIDELRANEHRIPGATSRIAELGGKAGELRELATSDRGRADELTTHQSGVLQSAIQAREEAQAQQLVAAKAGDAASEARKKVTDADSKKQGEDREARIAQAEVDAQNQLAALQSEGIQRARDEYEIRRQLLETKLRETEAEGDAVKLAKLRSDYYRDQQAQARKEEESTKATANSIRALNDEIASRQDAADKRQIEHDARTGKITDEQRRKSEAEILDRQRIRLEADAAAKEQEARDALAKGDKDKAARITTEAQQIHAQADAKKDEEISLFEPPKPGGHAVADSLARIGAGGNAFSHIDTGAEARRASDKQITLLSNIEAVLKEVRDKRQDRGAPGYFGR